MRVKFVGVLDPYFETGTEGTVWSLIEDGKPGYDGLRQIENGDHLTIYMENGAKFFLTPISFVTGKSDGQNIRSTRAMGNHLPSAPGFIGPNKAGSPMTGQSFSFIHIFKAMRASRHYARN